MNILPFNMTTILGTQITVFHQICNPNHPIEPYYEAHWVTAANRKDCLRCRNHNQCDLFKCLTCNRIVCQHSFPGFQTIQWNNKQPGPDHITWHSIFQAAVNRAPEQFRKVIKQLIKFDGLYDQRFKAPADKDFQQMKGGVYQYQINKIRAQNGIAYTAEQNSYFNNVVWNILHKRNYLFDDRLIIPAVYKNERITKALECVLQIRFQQNPTQQRLNMCRNCQVPNNIRQD